MARFHWDTPEMPGISLLTLGTLCDGIIAELSEDEFGEREYYEDLWKQQGIHIDYLDANGKLHVSWPIGWHLAIIALKGFIRSKAAVASRCN
jgi:hypothetical protein